MGIPAERKHVETHACHFENRERGHRCEVVDGRSSFCCDEWREVCFRLHIRGPERLVGQQDGPQEVQEHCIVLRIPPSERPAPRDGEQTSDPYPCDTCLTTISLFFLAVAALFCHIKKGSSDFKCRVFSTFASEVDPEPQAGPFGTPLEFGEAYCELSASGWINCVTWTPSGATLVYAGHDSSIHFATFAASSAPVVCSVKVTDLPYCSLLAVSEKAVVAVGYDFNPSVFTAASSSNWSLLGKLEVKVEAVAASSSLLMSASCCRSDMGAC